MWLEHKRKEKALDVMKQLVESGKEAPEPLLQALTKGQEEDWSMSGAFGSGQSGWTGVAFFVVLSVGFAIAAWMSDGRQTNAFWLVAGIMGAMAVLTAVSHLTRKKP
jgi:hypothetical protein